MTTPPTFEYFACVVDGKFVGAIGIHDQNGPMVEAMSSTPVIVRMTTEQHRTVRQGWAYDGETFAQTEPDAPMILASREVADARYESCLVCEQFINLTKQCKKCGCLMVVKTKLQHSVCPIGKW